MSAFADLSELINRATGGNSGAPQSINFMKQPRVAGAAAPATIAGRLHSLWLYEGNPSHGSAPGAWANPDNATNGGMKQTDPSGGRQLWCTYGVANALVQGTLSIYDRLGANGNLSGTVTTAQSITGSITRNTGGERNELFAEIYTIIGTTGTTITCSYTNQAGTASQVTQPAVFGGTGFREVTRMIPLPLAAGDYGVRAVASATVLASTTTAGAFGITIARKLFDLPCDILGAGAIMSALQQGAGEEIVTDACLFGIWKANGVTAPELSGKLFACER